MLSGIVGRKVGMTQIFSADGTAIPVTVIEAGPCAVTQVKTEAKDGYEAVQLGFGEAKHATRPMLGHLGHSLPVTPRQRRKQQQEQAKVRQRARQQREAAEEAESGTETEADVAEATGETTATSNQPRASRRRRGAGKALGPYRVLREVKVLDGKFPAVGDTIDAGMFSPGEEVDIIGTSKGKGFAGVMKRHNFRGGPRTHGQSDRARAPGSVGPGTTPGRVFKGTRMAGRMGNERVTVKALLVVQADPERNLLVIRGSVPGPNGGLVIVRKGAAQMARAARQSA